MKCKLGAANEGSQGLSWLKECTWATGHKGDLLSKAVKLHPIITLLKILLPLQIQLVTCRCSESMIS